MAQKTFVITIKINGKSVDSLPGATLTFGLPERTPITVNGVAGRHFTENPQPGRCTFKIAHGADGPTLDEIRTWKEVTLVAECDSGVKYQMAGAYTTNAGELADGDGAFNVEMAGPPWQEI